MQKELGSAFLVICQAISKRLHALEMTQKQGTWFLYVLKLRDVVISSPVNNCSTGAVSTSAARSNIHALKDLLYI